MNHKKTKKLLVKTIILLALFSLVCFVSVKAADTTVGQTSVGQVFTFPWTGITSLGKLVQQIYLISLGLIGVLALGMIIFGGVLYSTSAGDPSRQKDARDRITQAIWGVILLLAAFLILNTINPDLVKLKDPDLVKIDAAPAITGYESGLYDTETPAGLIMGKHYKIVHSLSSVLDPLKNYSGYLSASDYYLLVDKSEYMMYIMDRKTNKVATINGAKISAPAVNFGSNDNSQGTGREGDKTTPIGKFQLTAGTKIGMPDREDTNPYDAGSRGNAVLTNDGKYNLGTAAIYLSVPNRTGIAFHGSENDTNGSTNGCIRMRNADVLLLAKKLQPSMWVIIQN